MTAPAWWVYVVRCADGSLYTGVARDLAARIAAHDAGRGARYTRGRGPVTLVYREGAADRASAQRREAAIKRLPAAAKAGLAGPAAASGSPAGPGPAGTAAAGGAASEAGVPAPASS
jgi:putative endonuclease